MPRRSLLLPLLAVFLLGLGGLGWGYWSAAQSVATPPPVDRNAYVGSNTCKSCHSQHHASWGKTYHRTMTQEASAKSVQGDFSGKPFLAWGQPMKAREEAGRFYFDYLRPNGQTAQSVELVRTVGSHRYQQYLSKDDSGRYARMHLIWHNGEQRWVHYNAAFLYDDSQHFNEHAALWNPNCIFCHNTGVKPGMQNAEELDARVSRGESFDYLNAAQWDSQVAELGIACEACHGPGGTHAGLNRNPLRRLALRMADGKDGSIVNLKRLPTEKSSEVCGQCHAQRLPKQAGAIYEWLKTGPSYRPGDDLDEHVALLSPTTPGSPERPDLFAQRFWKDGTPRLSAYEWTSLKLSACAQEASCISCHSGHKGEPAGMLSEAQRAGSGCLSCHAEAQTQPFHQKHAAASAATNCVDCHMPKSIYGVMEIHRSHRIRSPEPKLAAEQARPEVCTGCHGANTADWADAAIKAWGQGAAAPAADATALPENLKQLFAGDAVQRAVAAKLAGLPAAALSPEQRRAQLPLLVAAMDDSYPALRRFAWYSATASAEVLKLSALQAALKQFDYLAPGAARAQALAAIAAALPPPEAGPSWGGLLLPDGRINPERIAELRAAAAKDPIFIGE